MPKHEMWELKSMQAAPLNVKVLLTKQRIRDWVNHYGEDGVYISFSGGKDSTVLLHLVRELFPDVPAVFVDVPTQYPELREFAKTFDNVEIIRPKISFIEVCEKYGFPLISKEVSEKVYYAQKCIEEYLARKEGGNAKTTLARSWWRFEYLTGVPRGTIKGGGVPDEYINVLQQANKCKINQLLGTCTYGDGKSTFDASKYLFMVNAPFRVGNQCCKVMKKAPVHAYAKRTGRVPFVGQMAEESRLRLQSWINHGCNAFDAKSPVSNPLSFWTEQDILRFIKENNISICSVYGDVVEDLDGTNEVEGQMTISDLEGFENYKQFDAERPPLKTTGCKRTGCMLCGFGCHLEKPGRGRFELLKKTHPGMYKMLDVVKNNGVTMRQAIDWINENGHLNIRY